MAAVQESLDLHLAQGLESLGGVRKRRPRMPKKVSFQEQMADWPKRWAGFEADEEVGQRMVDELRLFIEYLEQSGLTKKTLQRHLTWLWAIGGEIIREVHDEEERRTWTGRKLLETAVENGEAPMIRGANEDEQSRADGTARKLRKFFMNSAQ